MKNPNTISPDMKVSELLESFPYLEEELIKIAPAFRNLKNPLLRRTIARVTSLSQAARVGGVPVGFVINRLRAVAGADEMEHNPEPVAPDPAEPAWFIPVRIRLSIDARPVIAAGGHPLDQVFRESSSLEKGDILELITPFLPAPLIDKMENRGFACWSTDQMGIFYNYFCKES
jgi:hypothetical protein